MGSPSDLKIADRIHPVPQAEILASQSEGALTYVSSHMKVLRRPLRSSKHWQNSGRKLSTPAALMFEPSSLPRASVGCHGIVSGLGTGMFGRVVQWLGWSHFRLIVTHGNREYADIAVVR